MALVKGRMRHLLLPVIILLGCGCHLGEPPGRLVVVHMAPVPIYEDEFLVRWHRARLERDDGGAAPKMALQIHKRAILQDMIERRLLLREAERAQVNVLHQDVEAALSRMQKGYSSAEFAASLQQQNLTQAEVRGELRDSLVVRKYIRDFIYARVAVTDAQIEAAASQQHDLLVPDEVHVRHIVVKAADVAKDIVQQLAAGMRFEDAAVKYSLSPDGKGGGDLGFFARGVMPSVFDEVCFSLPIGRPSSVIASPYGFHVFLVVERRQARSMEAAMVQKTMEQALRHPKERQALHDRLQALQTRAGVHVEEDRLARLD